MKQFFITVLGVIVGGFVFLILMFMVLAGIGGAIAASSAPKAVSGDTVLSLDLRGPMLDHSAGENLFGSAPNSVVDTVRALNRAKTDDDVKGLFIRAGYGMAPASAEEIRLAIVDFKDSGKFVITHSQGFESTSVIPYMAVSASDEIWMQATTGFSVAGLYSESEFYGGVFEKYDAKPQFAQFYEYKSAANTYTESDMTSAQREATTSYMTSLYDIALGHMSDDRNMSVEAVTGVLSTAPHSAEAALEAGMIDKLGYFVDALDAAKTRAAGEGGDKDKIKMRSVKSYGAGSSSSGEVIAFIGGQGPITMGGSQDGSNPFSSALSIGSDTVSKAFKDAAKNEKVKAIVFRVSSPGGSATASDDIYNAVMMAKDAGKPVVISMGQYAASGGYYVAAPADKIVAMPSTITGSIGVLGGKIALRDTFAKVGFNIESVKVGGDYAGVYSGDEPMTQAQLKAFTDQMEDIYVDFTGIVAEGRDMPIEDVREVAKGRVWTGEQAKSRGLVDEFGGFLRAVDVAKDMAGLETDDKIRLRRYPRPKTRSQQFEELFNVAIDAKSDLEALRELSQTPEMKALLAARAKAEALARGDATLKVDMPAIE